jgi:anti-sigma regulatory factor (Ser/Thr protein kinase)
MGLVRTLPADPDAPGTARRALSRLRDRMKPATYGNLELVVSELVANAVLHPRMAESGVIGLTVEISPGQVRVEVTDQGEPSGEGGPFGTEGSTPRSRGGFGLSLVDRLAERWGVEHRPSTMVWAEIPLEGKGSQAGGRDQLA